MRKIHFLLIFFLGCFLWSCASLLYMPSSPDAAQQERLLAGRKLYVNHCGGCHNLHLPKEYDAEGWNNQLDEMKVKAKITEADKQLILEYLTSEK